MSTFTIVDSCNAKRWDEFVYQHPKGSIFHTSQMVAVLRATRRCKPLAFAALDRNGDLLAILVAARVQTLPDPFGRISSRSIWYAEPLCCDNEQGVAALRALIAHHDNLLRHQVLFTEVRPLIAAGREREALESCGYEYKEYLNYTIDLRQSPEQIWSKISKSCRKDISRSHRRGLRVEEHYSAQSVDILYHFLRLSYDNSKVPLADKSMFVAAQQILQPLGMLKIYVASLEDRPVAACALLCYKQTLYAWYAGVERSKTVNPAECLHWHKLEWGAQNNFAIYDFGGAGWPDQPYGVRDFKAKFGGDLVNYGRYRKIYSPWKLMLAERAYELSRQLRNLRKRPSLVENNVQPEPSEEVRA